MKKMPTIWRRRYAGESFGNDGVYDGFTPYRKDEDTYISERVVEIEQSKWNGGSVLIVRYFDKSTTAEFKLHEFDIFTHNNYHDGQIEPNAEQEILIDALCSDDLRGRYAEMVAYKLFVDLIVFKENSKFKEYFPEVYAWYKKNYR